MPIAKIRLGLFARTFFLLALLMLASLATWLHVFWTLERAPRVEQIAHQMVRNVQMIEAIKAVAPQEDGREILRQIVGQTDLMLLEPGRHSLMSLPDTADWQAITALIEQQLGQTLSLATSNALGQDLWVQLPDGQWLGMDIEKLRPASTPEWVSWIAAATLLSIFGAAIAVGYINRPLTRLARAAQELSRGQTPAPLPETGAQEIEQLNASFNRMITELQQAQANRNLMLAGISHDLRTPLARLRLDIEMSPMSASQRHAIDQDLSQIDRIIGQLLQYAKPPNDPPEQTIEAAMLVREVVEQWAARTEQNNVIQIDVRSQAHCRIDPDDLRRCIINLLENAQRHGRCADGCARIDVLVHQRGPRLLIDIRDQGPGIDSEQTSHLLQPFTQGQSARSNTTGAGLGLAIVQRLLARPAGHLHLLNRQSGGLIARIDLARIKSHRA